LEEFDYEIQYRPGKHNTNADSLSRYPVECLNINVEKLTEDRKGKIISEMHNCPVGGHQGIQRTIERIKLYMSWPGLEQVVVNFVKNCKICQVNKGTRPKIRQPLEITDTRSSPWDKIYLDVVGPLNQTESNMKYILTCEDNLSKYFIAIPMQN
jgi:hypothetical protein